MRYFFMVLRVMGIITDWSSKALVDGKVTLNEAVDLAVRVAEALSIPTDIQLPK
ncbi:unnamed protein product [marine sediment metagenome]